MKRLLVAAFTSLAVVAVAQDRQTGQPHTQQPHQSQTDQRNRDTDRGRIETKTAAEIQQTVNQATISLESGMRTAERSAPSGAKLVGAAFCVWEEVEKGLNRDTSLNKDNSAAENKTPGTPENQRNTQNPSNPSNPGNTQTNTQNMTMPANHPVVKVCFVGNNRLTEVVVCGKSGQVVGTKELSNIQTVARAN